MPTTAGRWFPVRADRGRRSSTGASGRHCRSVPARPIRRSPPGPACGSVAPHQRRNGAAPGPSGPAGRPDTAAPAPRFSRRFDRVAQPPPQPAPEPARRPAGRLRSRPDGARESPGPFADRTPLRRPLPVRAGGRFVSIGCGPRRCPSCGHGRCTAATRVAATSPPNHHPLSDGEGGAPRPHCRRIFSPRRHRRRPRPPRARAPAIARRSR